MRVTNILKDPIKLRITIETETDRSFLWFKLPPIKRTFIANEEYPKGYWNWVELPNKTIVGEKLYFQLNKWLQFDLK